MSMTVNCDIVSAEREIFSGSVQLVVASATEGEVGIAYGHAPFLSSLNPGPIRVMTSEGGEEIFYLSGGYIEVQPHSITVLADTALRAGDMDEEAALSAMKAAEDALRDQPSGLDYSRAATQLAEAAAQVRTLKAIRKKLNK